ncbi:MAG: hypothetical protein JNM45_02945 [Rhizobiales bacterium]|nr:hypothetical protein [Hyphomicrobiales bacterium]
MAREGNSNGGAGQPVLYDQSDASRLSELDPEVVAYCVQHNLVKPVSKDGKTWFTGSDILKLKLLRTLLLSRKLSAALDSAFLRIGRDLMDDRGSDLNETNDELARLVQQLLSRFRG